MLLRYLSLLLLQLHLVLLVPPRFLFLPPIAPHGTEHASPDEADEGPCAGPLTATRNGSDPGAEEGTPQRTAGHFPSTRVTRRRRHVAPPHLNLGLGQIGVETRLLGRPLVAFKLVAGQLVLALPPLGVGEDVPLRGHLSDGAQAERKGEYEQDANA
jgi:hypothetical protein